MCSNAGENISKLRMDSKARILHEYLYTMIHCWARIVQRIQLGVAGRLFLIEVDPKGISLMKTKRMVGWGWEVPSEQAQFVGEIHESDS